MDGSYFRMLWGDKKKYTERNKTSSYSCLFGYSNLSKVENPLPILQFLIDNARPILTGHKVDTPLCIVEFKGKKKEK